MAYIKWDSTLDTNTKVLLIIYRDYAKVADITGIKKSIIKARNNRVWRIPVGKVKWTRNRRDLVINLLEKGQNISEIAASLKVSPNTIRILLSRVKK